jgi:predicted NUDIX family NTP pyrophosphohydrolase
MGKQSAGILLYRIKNNSLQVFLVHPGGPFWKNKDAGAWSVPKGEFLDDEDALLAARREFQEETGQTVDGKFIKLKPVKQKSGKVIYAWAVEGDIDESNIVCNIFQLEWPPKSGKITEIPEIDKAEWLDLTIAKQKINPAQAALIEELVSLINP